jgi:hypothetical protein
VSKKRTINILSVDEFDVIFLFMSIKPSKFRCNWMTPHQVVMESGIPYASVIRAIREGELPAHSLGRSPKAGYLIYKTEFEDWKETIDVE